MAFFMYCDNDQISEIKNFMHWQNEDYEKIQIVLSW